MTNINLNYYQFLTTYTKDYTQKPIKLIPKTIQRQEFPDPISEGHKHYLLLNGKNISPPNEDGEEYLEKFKEKYKGISKVYFQDPIQKDVILNEIQNELVSEYQKNYCDLEKDLEYFARQKSKTMTLPDNIDIPLTTYRTHFKDPIKLCPALKEKSLIIIRQPSLGVIDKKFNIALDDITECYDHIGRLGEFIVKTRAHGRLGKTK